MNDAHSDLPIRHEIDGRKSVAGHRPRAILPGSFNPLHKGHLALANAAFTHLGFPVEFELSIVNVDKPSLVETEVNLRVAQFTGVAPIWVTQAAIFSEKARHFPAAVFVVGFDTAIRLVDVKYYRDDASLMEQSLKTIQELGCRFLVGGRIDAKGVFRTWEPMHSSARFDDLFESLTAEAFRIDLSSTSLRQSG